jgi:hypothetical protein
MQERLSIQTLYLKTSMAAFYFSCNRNLSFLSKRLLTVKPILDLLMIAT